MFLKKTFLVPKKPHKSIQNLKKLLILVLFKGLKHFYLVKWLEMSIKISCYIVSGKFNVLVTPYLVIPSFG